MNQSSYCRVDNVKPLSHVESALRQTNMSASAVIFASRLGMKTLTLTRVKLESEF